ncbi:MAG: glycerophosphodiester phosphodiesterase family protein [Cyclobacteriaceae bacterium]|nr:glycerophosphodiester phosphodiesterase family protein [Cyclobacteriaceae bacterium]
MKKIAVLVLLLTSKTMIAQVIDVQGHRGCRGLMPENTIPAFLKALDLGVTTIELDVVVSKDGKIVVSHDPYLNPDICLSPDGEEIGDKGDFNLYNMTYDEILRCDCGSKGNPKFEEQGKQTLSKPLLSDVIKKVEWHIKSYTQYEVDYNIEIKSTQSGDNVYHPTPAIFSELVYELIDKYIPIERIIIQSFDFRVLKYWHKMHPQVRLAALVDNQKSIQTNLANLGFKPNVYSCYYPLLDEGKVRYLQKNGMKVIPWTVNDTTIMNELVRWGVNGIITDYPDRAQELGYISTKRDEK